MLSCTSTLTISCVQIPWKWDINEILWIIFLQCIGSSIFRVPFAMSYYKNPVSLSVHAQCMRNSGSLHICENTFLCCLHLATCAVGAKFVCLYFSRNILISVNLNLCLTLHCLNISVWILIKLLFMLAPLSLISAYNTVLDRNCDFLVLVTLQIWFIWEHSIYLVIYISATNKITVKCFKKLNTLQIWHWKWV